MSQDWRDHVEQRFQKYAICFQRENEKLIPVDNYASVALILVQSEQRPGLLIIKRQKNPDDPWSGHMALPGGRGEKGEGPIETACRETFEEIGLELKPSRYLMDPVEARARQSMASFLIYPSVFISDFDWSNISPSLHLCPLEVESVHFFSLQELLDPRYQSQVHWSLGGRDLTLPSIQIGRFTIWGLTYWILEQFFKDIEGLDLSSDERVNLKNWKEHPIY